MYNELKVVFFLIGTVKYLLQTPIFMKIYVEGDVAYLPFSKKIEKMGFGVKRGGKIILHPIEVLYLILNRDYEIHGKNTTDVFKWCLEKIENFMPFYCVYEDLRKRGYYVNILEDVLVGKHVYYPVEEVRNVNVCDIVKFENLVLAVVDEECEITYYKVEEIYPRGKHKEEEFKVRGILLGNSVFTEGFLHERYFYGSLKGNMTILSILESAYLMEKGMLEVYEGERSVSLDKIMNIGRSKDPRFDRRFEVYKDLKEKGFVVKTGLKFGSDFRLYEYISEELPHSKYLVNIFDRPIPAFEIVRAVRLAQSVRKTLLFACKGNKYIAVERVKV